jgi:LPS-assembly lipoprotein
MSSLERRQVPRLLRAAAAIGLAALLAGCFQPLYGERSLTGGPGVREAMARVDVAQINASAGTPLSRSAVELRNELLFGLTGGGASLPPTHRLDISLQSSVGSIIVDPSTARPEYEIVGLTAIYKLTEKSTGKVVFDSVARASVSYNIPGQQQRLSTLVGQREGLARATKVIADQIKTRVASFMSAGT